MPEQPNGSCFFFGDFPLCGCGQPDKALDLIYKILAEAEKPWDARKPLTEVVGGEDGVHWLALYALDNAGLIEHGGSIGHSWLTSKGEAALEYLTKHGTDSDAWDHETKITWKEA